MTADAEQAALQGAQRRSLYGPAIGSGSNGDSAETVSAARSFAAFDARNTADASPPLSQGPPPQVLEAGGWGTETGVGSGGMEQIATLQRTVAAEGESQLDDRPGRVQSTYNADTHTEVGASNSGLGNHVRRSKILGDLCDDGPVRLAPIAPTAAEAAHLSATAEVAINVAAMNNAAASATNGGNGGGGSGGGGVKKDASGAAQVQDKAALRSAADARLRAAERTKSLVAVKRYWKAEVERDPMAGLHTLSLLCSQCVHVYMYAPPLSLSPEVFPYTLATSSSLAWPLVPLLRVHARRLRYLLRRTLYPHPLAASCPLAWPLVGTTAGNSTTSGDTAGDTAGGTAGITFGDTADHTAGDTVGDPF
jgi:hypothetical protein